MYCRKCGTVLEEPGNFCTKCGAPVSSVVGAPANATAPHKSRLATYLIGAGCLLLFIAMVGSVTNNGTSSSNSTSMATSNAASTTPESAAVHHKIKETVTVGYWSYMCSSAHWRSTIGSSYSQQYPDASFLVIKLAVRNNDKTASVLPPMKLVDAQGREFDESSKGIFLEDSFGVLKNVNPGVTSYGNAVFDVPRGTYMLKVSGGFTSGQNILIDLE